MTLRRLSLLTVVGAFVAFCVVQDLVTAAGARRYVEIEEEALAGAGPRVTVDQVMKPAIAQSVRDGLLASGAVAALGVGAMIRARRSRS